MLRLRLPDARGRALHMIATRLWAASSSCPPSPARLACLGAALLGAALLLAGCVTPSRAPPAAVVDVAVPVSAPVATRGAFTIAADKLDVWNAVGQIVVRTDGARYESRAQMLDLYAVSYRGESFLLLTRALPLSDALRTSTTLVTAATSAGRPIDSPASADLLALLQQALPAEITRVQATQAAQKAQAKKATRSKPSPRARRHR